MIFVMFDPPLHWADGTYPLTKLRGRVRKNKKEIKMKTTKKILLIGVVALLAVAVGLSGNLDYDEYIEVNSTPKVRMWPTYGN